METHQICLKCGEDITGKIVAVFYKEGEKFSPANYTGAAYHPKCLGLQEEERE